MTGKLLFSTILVIVIAATGLLTWTVSYRAALNDLNVEANQNLTQVVDQFTGQVSAARFLPTLLARNNEIIASLENDSVSDIVKEYLERARDLSGIFEIRILNSSGDQLFSTGNDNDRNNSESHHFSKAMQGVLGVEINFNQKNNIRTFIFSRSIIGKSNNQIGVIVLELAIEALESEFSARPEIIMFLDSSGTVVFSNRTRLIANQLVPYQSNLQPLQSAHVSGLNKTIRNPVSVSKNGSVSIVESFALNPSSTKNLVTGRLILPLGLEALLVQDTKKSVQQARKITSLVIALLTLAIVIAIAIYQRRKRLMERIEAEQALNDELDRRVELRSNELEHAQNELVQSAKLSALGTMSAGISHELNQPIASIQNFSVNAKRFLVDGRVEESLENLTEIELLTERMSRIIRNLRDFSRKDGLPSEPVDICKVINQVAQMLQRRLEEEKVDLSLVNTEKSIMVVGGDIRLQQVLINLLTNAIDAIKGQHEKHIELKVVRLNNIAKVSIRDNGPGLPEPNRVFEPFYTTKTGSHDDGLGLGLSIAYGFVDSFGGKLTASNNEGGGALFTLQLPTQTDTRQRSLKLTRAH